MTLPRSRPAPGIPWISLALCGAMVAFHAFGALSEAGPEQKHQGLRLVLAGAKSASLIADAGEGWRLLTAPLVHTSWMHVAFNVAFLLPVTAALEVALRRSDFVMWLCAVTVGSGLFSLLWTPQISCGASGLVFGAMATAILLGLRYNANFAPRARRYFGLWVLPFLIAIVLASGASPEIDHFCHLGGFLAGVAVSPALRLRTHRSTASHETGRVALSTVMCALALFASPALARRGQTPQHLHWQHLDLTIPPSWQAEFGPFGEVRYRGASRLANLSLDELPTSKRDVRSVAQWYAEDRLQELGGDAAPAVVFRRIDQGHAATKRFRFVFDSAGVPTVRDVEFFPSSTGTLAVSFETPRVWFRRYRERRQQVFASVREGPGTPPEPSSDPTSAVAASIDSRPGL